MMEKTRWDDYLAEASLFAINCHRAGYIGRENGWPGDSRISGSEIRYGAGRSPAGKKGKEQWRK